MPGYFACQQTLRQIHFDQTLEHGPQKQKGQGFQDYGYEMRGEIEHAIARVISGLIEGSSNKIGKT